ncbi:FAD-binding protein [Sphingobium sufflavum]|uniref:FAD-dependent oxidoreductase n=1 Tax=Sphingobium sufflavum TaxID=1129547 RepID=UPI001F1EA2CD|nr:FAD-dependent oxidoreductase [Sphingobium sufflavum]MCE7796134.1 FAD-binding protein [Sphingobium sufflavum]
MGSSRIWDVVVVGAGGAGLTAARRARESGADVLVLNKGLVGRTGATITSGGGISVSGNVLAGLGLDVDPTDTEQDFAEDTIRSGRFISDQSLVQSMVEDVGAELGALMAMGVKPRVSKRAPGHSSGRGVHVTGPDMQKAVTTGATRAGVLFREDFLSAGLLRDAEGAVVGVTGLDRRTGEVAEIDARAVVIATGGTTSNWRLRTAPEELAGEGHAMALEAGAALIESEMLQFLPCCVIAPEIWKGIQFPWTIGPQAGVRAWLLNRYGERFLQRWDPVNIELATRDVVAAGSAAEVAAGRGSPNGGVYLSWAHLPRDIIDNMPLWSKSLSRDGRYQGFDFTPLIERIKAGYAIEVAPAAHFSLGGIHIDVDGDTGVPGLYACGEAAGGVHGSNRLSGNAGAQMLVQGARAGLAAARASRRNGLPAPAVNRAELQERVRAPMEREAGIAPLEVAERLGALTDSALSPVRDGTRIDAAIVEIGDIRRSVLPQLAVRQRDPGYNRDWSTAIECRAAVDVLEAALLGARARGHSLGAHQRTDSLDEAARPAPFHGLVRATGGALVHETRAVAFPVLAP